MAGNNEGTGSRGPDVATMTEAMFKILNSRFIKPAEVMIVKSVLFAFVCSALAQSGEYKECYLMPINPVRPFEQSVERLLGKRWGRGTMIYRDVMEQSFAISAWGGDNKPKTLTYLKLTREGESTRVIAEANVAIDDEFAEGIEEAWSAMLLKTRYPDKLFSSNHGWDVEFSAWIQYAGGVYGRGTPIMGVSKELMDFGFTLRDYCLADQQKRQTERDELIPRLKEFAARVKESHLY